MCKQFEIQTVSEHDIITQDLFNDCVLQIPQCPNMCHQSVWLSCHYLSHRSLRSRYGNFRILALN